MNRFYTLDDHATESFYKLEKSLFINEKYRKISIGAKTTYAILRDRQDLSIRNEWLDEEGRIYFYFDCTKLSEILNVSTNTVNKYKKELVESELLFQKRMGQGNPNRLYILKPETVAITLNSENCISRNTKTVVLEILKPLANETECSETERKRLRDNIILSNDGRIFLETFEDYFGYSHRNINDEPYLDTALDGEELAEVFREYFDIYSNGNKKHDMEKCSIDNVFASFQRYEKNGNW